MRWPAVFAVAMLLALTGCFCVPDPGDKVLSLSYFSNCWDTAAHGHH